MEPFYKLDELTTKRILKLIETCDGFGLGNVNFTYYATPGHEEVDLNLSLYNSGWELVVIVDRPSARDMYKIVNGQIKHDYSEKD